MVWQVGGSGPAAHVLRQTDLPDPKAAVASAFRAFSSGIRSLKGTNPSATVARGFEVVEEADPTVASIPDREVLEAHAEVIRGGGRYWVGGPYEIAGQLYEPKEDPAYDRTGRASWYGASFHGRLTANGEIFDRMAISAAHPTLPLPSYVRVTNLNNDRSIVVRVNDRGPYADARLIDVSEQTAALLGFRRYGLTRVRVEYVSKAPLDGDDKEALLATYDGPPATRPPMFLASAAPAMPVAANAIAFAAERPSGPQLPAAAAIEKLTVSIPASKRIVVAFQAAEEAEE
jgi:rare lipoprotein A